MADRRWPREMVAGRGGTGGGALAGVRGCSAEVTLEEEFLRAKAMGEGRALEIDAWRAWPPLVLSRLLLEYAERAIDGAMEGDVMAEVPDLTETASLSLPFTLLCDFVSDIPAWSEGERRDCFG